ncbi:MAG: flagellar assembly protein FliH [Burkholderiales bacterium]|nr:flagellar assembly protein FliH [Burkholderiales bacterium]
MSTSKPPVPPVPPSGVPNPYARFIPREELGSFSAWNPQSLEASAGQTGAQGPTEESGTRKPSFSERAAATVSSVSKAATTKPAAKAAARQATVTPIRRPLVGGVPGEETHEPAPAQSASPPEAAPDLEALVDQARKDGYQDGYRNGLVALESYKLAQEAQMAAYMSDQVGALAGDFHRRLDSLEQQLAGRIAGVALELARQVVRSELEQRPEGVLTVAEEALGVLLASARQIVLRLNPEDHAMAQGALTEVMQTRGGRLMPDPSVTRGGCVVESDIAVVDASVEARWQRAAAAMGSQSAWNEGYEVPYSPVAVDDQDMVDELLNGGGA